jgi:hypothetical protein
LILDKSSIEFQGIIKEKNKFFKNKDSTLKNKLKPALFFIKFLDKPINLFLFFKNNLKIKIYKRKDSKVNQLCTLL